MLNAGLSLNVGDKEEQFTQDGYELTVGTNHIGHFALAQQLLPALSKGAAPRLVVTASARARARTLSTPVRRGAYPKPNPKP